MKNKKKILSVLMILVVFFVSCSKDKNQPEQPPPIPLESFDKHIQKRPVLDTYYSSLPPAEGSLFTDYGTILYVDNQARRVGDTITIDIVENASSKVTADTDTSRASSIDASISNLGGLEVWLDDQTKYLDLQNLLKASLANSHSGKGETNREGSVTATIGARVTAVLPNGNLQLYGYRETKVNNETQFIVVSGIVRPDDIGPLNRINSTYLADAKIAFYGKGVVADKQRAGWLTRAVDFVWPF